jgi:putative ABC transport system permease protein
METRQTVRPANDEIVVGNLVTSPIGTQSYFFGDKFRVAARLDRTGMGFDTSIFMPLDTARDLLRKRQSTFLENVPEGSVSSSLLSLDAGVTPLKIMGAIRQALGREYQLDFIVAKDMIADMANRLSALTVPIALTTIFTWLGATGVMFLFFSVLVNERRRELSMLRVMGASLRRVNRMLFCEALILSGSGAALGLLAAAATVLPFQNLILKSIGLPYLLPGYSGIVGLALLSILASLSIGPLASLYAVAKNGRQEIYSNLRSGE